VSQTDRELASVDADALFLARGLARVGGPSVRGVVFFGSRRSGARTDAWSAHDLFVATGPYRDFYASLAAAGQTRRPAALHAVLNALMPPSQLAFALEQEAGPSLHAKCAVIRLDSLERETSERRHDHFCIGRLFQPTAILYASEPADRERLQRALERALSLTYAWVRPWLPEPFDPESYGLTALRVSLGGEIRPEPTSRAQALWQAQREEMLPRLAALLNRLHDQGELEQVAGGYALRRPATRSETLRLRVYFAWSKLRATLRWAKYMLTFEGWLAYIVRKVQRHAGAELALSERERRWPLVFLWPKLLRYWFRRNKSR
jgi:hypothetical protein